VSALIAGGQGKRLSSLRDQMGIVESRITWRSAVVTLQALVSDSEAKLTRMQRLKKRKRKGEQKKKKACTVTITK
jgi:hypothetical protein